MGGAVVDRAVIGGAVGTAVVSSNPVEVEAVEGPDQGSGIDLYTCNNLHVWT